jgi:hypothetical protein
MGMPYLITIEVIHAVICMLVEGEDITKGFQGPNKITVKSEEENMYKKYGTILYREGDKINLINDVWVKLTCQIMAR